MLARNFQQALPHRFLGLDGKRRLLRWVSFQIVEIFCLRPKVKNQLVSRLSDRQNARSDSILGMKGIGASGYAFGDCHLIESLPSPHPLKTTMTSKFFWDRHACRIQQGWGQMHQAERGFILLLLDSARHT